MIHRFLLALFAVLLVSIDGYGCSSTNLDQLMCVSTGQPCFTGDAPCCDGVCLACRGTSAGVCVVARDGGRQ